MTLLVKDVNELPQEAFPMVGEVRGFAHINEAGEWFLTDSPVLKSCCQAAPQENEVVFLKDTQGLNAKKLYTFQGEINKTGKKKELKGVLVEGRMPRFAPLLAVIGVAAILSYFIAKRWGK